MKKRSWKVVIDIAMVICLPVLMAYQLVGEALHEWVGMVMFVLMSLLAVLIAEYGIYAFHTR